MNVSLTPRLEDIVRKKVESGLYNNASEVVREAIRQMDERDQHMARLRAALAEGKESLRHGVPYRWHEGSVDEMLAMARQADIDEADAEVERGETMVWTETSLEEIIQEAHEADRQGLPIDEHVQP